MCSMHKQKLARSHSVVTMWQLFNKMFRLMVFNVKIGNKDDHAKNFAFIYDSAVMRWRLSPAYDLTQNNGIAGEHTTTINGKGKNITHDDMLQVAARIGISSRKAKSIIEQVESVLQQPGN